MIIGAFAALALAAALIVLQGQMNGALQLKIGLIGTIFWAHFIVTIILLPVVAYYYSDIAASVNSKLLKDSSYTLLIGGLFGVVIVPALAFAIPVIGLKNAFFCLVIMQVLFSVVLEYFGQGTGLGLRDIAGIIMLAAAGWLVIYR